MGAETAIVFGCLLPGLHIAYTDIKKGVIYDVVTLLILLAGFGFAVITDTYINALFGCSLGFLSFFIAAWITNGAIGGGDIKLAAGIGMWFGYPHTVEVLIAACLAAIIFELIRYWKSGTLNRLFKERLGPYTRKILLRFGYRVKDIDLSIDGKYAAIPFGPFLVFSSWFIWMFHLLI